MRAIVRDKEALAAVTLLELSSYLKATGWSEASRFDRFAVWRRLTDSGEAELIVPLSRDAGDFVPRIADALVLLEAVEARSQVEILRDLTYASSDLVRVRRSIHDDRDGSISMDEGVALVESARQMMISAACSTVFPKPVFAARRPARAAEYLRSLRFGQTERGSYVVTIISRVAPLLVPGQQNLLEVVEEPFPRQVTRVLANALDATSRASDEAATSGSFDAFQEAVSSGVSANLCDAIVTMAKTDSGVGEVSVATFWAASRPYQENPRPVTRFAPDAIPILEEAARLFRQAEPIEDATIVGPVVNLHRDPDAPFGIATVACVVDGKPLQLRVQLRDQEYQQAIRAHRDHRALAFQADVVREGRGSEGQNIQDLRVLEEA